MWSLQAPDRLHLQHTYEASAMDHPKDSPRPMGLRLGLDLRMASGTATTKQEALGFPVPEVTSHNRR